MSARQLLIDKTTHAGRQLRHLPASLEIIYRASGAWSLTWLALLLVAGILPVATVYLVRGLVDALASSSSSSSGSVGSSGSVSQLLLPAMALGGVLLLSEALRAASHWIAGVQAEKVGDHLADLIQRQSLRVDLEFYENSDFYDHLHRARQQAQQHPVALLESLGSLLQNGLTLTAMAAVLVPYSWWLPGVLLISTLPAVVAAVYFNLETYFWRRRTTAERRRAWYFDWLTGWREAAAEMRLLALGSWLRRHYSAIRGELRAQFVRLTRSRAVVEWLAAAIALASVAGVLWWMVQRVAAGSASLGDLALFYQAFQQGQRLMRSLLENVGDLYSKLFDIGDLFEFLDLEPTVTEPQAADAVAVPLELTQGIRFENVSFGYAHAGQLPEADPAPVSPSVSAPVLKGLDLEIPANRITAIVGSNGAGKSTLIKLICRLYDPLDGRVLIDGIDLRCFAVGELRAAISVMFQEPVRFQASVADNIRLGQLSLAEDEAALAAAASSAGASELVESLPRGYDTLLGSWFEGGRELSVGQWQRLALARAFLRQSPILLLDEPTSAMDAWSEVDWFKRFRQLAAGRTALLISHRLTTARQADVIHVLEAGHIIESGSHQELLAADGRYAESWRLQMRSSSEAEGAG